MFFLGGFFWWFFFWRGEELRFALLFSPKCLLVAKASLKRVRADEGSGGLVGAWGFFAPRSYDGACDLAWFFDLSVLCKVKAF